MIFEIKITFTAGHFHGDEWPPAPTRLFQAIVAATHHGAHGLINQQVRDKALRWFEQNPPPVIVAPDAVRSREHIKNWVPNNDDRLVEHIRSTDKPLGAWFFPANTEIAYRWDLSTSDVETSTDAEILRAAASLVTALGRSIDTVFVRAHLIEHDSTGRTDGVWHPEEMPGGEWRSPAPGFLDLLHRRYPRSVSTEPPDFANSRQVKYQRDGVHRADVPVEVFELRRPDGSLLSRDPRRLREIAGMVRHAILRWVEETDGVREHYGSDRIARFLFGHKAANSAERSAGGHFAVIPLPSMNADFTADGWIRRVAILGHGLATQKDRNLFDDLCRGLHGRFLEDNGRAVGGLRRLTGDAFTRALGIWQRSGTRWRSVTPVILTGHYRRGRSLEKCLLRALDQQGSCANEIESVATYSGPIIPKTFPARSYRVQGYLSTTERVHAEIIFRNAQSGPFVLGRGRFAGFGLGLFLPGRS